MTSRIAIVTDSTADIPQEFIDKYDITVVPLHVLWGSDNLRDSIDITQKQFYARLKTDPVLPTSSQPSPAAFAEAYNKLVDETGAEAILTMTISAHLSGTYASALQACSMVDVPAEAIDLRSASLGTALGILKVAESVKSGATFEEASTLAHDIANRAKLYFSPKTLEYLHKGGRIGGAKRLLGTAFNIKPILAVENGRIDAKESVRTRKRVVLRILEYLETDTDPNKPLHVGVLHSESEDEAQQLMEEIKKRRDPEFIFMGEIGAVIGVHVGPGALGYAFLQ